MPDRKAAEETWCVSQNEMAGRWVVHLRGLNCPNKIASFESEEEARTLASRLNKWIAAGCWRSDCARADFLRDPA